MNPHDVARSILGAETQVDHDHVCDTLASSLITWHRAIASARDSVAELDSARRQMLSVLVTFDEVQRAIVRPA